MEWRFSVWDLVFQMKKVLKFIIAIIALIAIYFLYDFFATTSKKNVEFF